MSQGRRRSPLPPDWNTRRHTVLTRDPICRLRIKCQGAPSAEVHHHKHHTDHRLTSLIGVCADCHTYVTARDAARIRNQAPHRRPKPPHPGFIR